MASHGVFITKDDKFHAGTGYRNVHTSEVTKEANLPLVVGAYERDENYITFLSLDPVNGIYAYELSEWFEERLFLYELP